MYLGEALKTKKQIKRPQHEFWFDEAEVSYQLGLGGFNSWILEVDDILADDWQIKQD